MSSISIAHVSYGPRLVYIAVYLRDRLAHGWMRALFADAKRWQTYYDRSYSNSVMGPCLASRNGPLFTSILPGALKVAYQPHSHSTFCSRSGYVRSEPRGLEANLVFSQLNNKLGQSPCAIQQQIQLACRGHGEFALYPCNVSSRLNTLQMSLLCKIALGACVLRVLRVYY